MKKIVISGGGTGGHIFPALAIAKALEEKYVDCQILFIGAKNRMEMEQIPRAGYCIEGLDIRGFNRQKLFSNFSLPFILIKSLIKARKILKIFQPNAVIGVGGYVSAAALWAASQLRIPYIIQEQNSFPGITNRILSKRAKVICVAYNGMEKWFKKDKIVLCGNPVRKEIVNIVQNYEQDRIQPKEILILGGSLGALSINESIVNNLQWFVSSNIHLIWQTGRSFFSKAKEITKKLGEKIDVYEFINEMDKAYTQADIIVSRAGALAIAELAIVGKPTILIPSPNVAEDHQTKNALSLSAQNAAILIKDSHASRQLIPTLETLINNPVLCDTLSKNIEKLSIKDADKKIVEQVAKYIK
ncbi:MAG: undecaprenyldiphospho-muramoylpentapeptide beta-N-acetylglucosaminyltransferase [Bacteroidales bacterium]|jgi:UDP-N-acetylglucosamine--N-acetylmuramyl-(pentapeptide) pyrophosphoryl-undecaprenol N-acetylglucosamine transferase|nr:undecaprenyldiphospho-muramoylpentapeptide beta-N-acetylglucosaminyltransferase [Bacteroidales bacterium]